MMVTRDRAEQIFKLRKTLTLLFCTSEKSKTLKSDTIPTTRFMRYPWKNLHRHQYVIKADRQSDSAVEGYLQPTAVCMLCETHHFQLIKSPTVILSEDSRTGKCAPLAALNLRDVLHIFKELLQLCTAWGPWLLLVESEPDFTPLNCLSCFCTSKPSGVCDHEISYDSMNTQIHMEDPPVTTLVILSS